MFRQRGEVVRILYAAGITIETSRAYDHLVTSLSHFVSLDKAHERARDVRRFLAKMIHLSPEPAHIDCIDPTCPLHASFV
jgi:hypothetical protein